MSIGWYDQDTALTSEMVFMQDYDPTDDANPYPATDGMDFADDPVFLDFNDSQNWLYFQVDTSISGEPMADPEDPPVDTGYTPIDASYITEIMYAFIQVVFILGLIGLVLKSFEKWGK
jgi:hypothetical protein